MDAFELITTRRSTRRFKKEKPGQKTIHQIVEAGRYAPSGGNNQTTHIFVIQDETILKQLAEMAAKTFAAMEPEEGMYPSLLSSIMQSKKGNYVFHYNAPVLIVTANRKDYGNNIADCACVLENMMIMANALDLGSCWINQLKWLNEDPGVLTLFRKLGLTEDERIYGALSLGYAETENGMPERTPLNRKGNPVEWI